MYRYVYIGRPNVAKRGKASKMVEGVGFEGIYLLCKYGLTPSTGYFVFRFDHRLLKLDDCKRGKKLRSHAGRFSHADMGKSETWGRVSPTLNWFCFECHVGCGTWWRSSFPSAIATSHG